MNRQEKPIVPLALRVCCIALLILCVAFSWTTMYKVSTTLLDSDASSELVLAHQMAQEGSLVLSKNWIYSTELRVLNTQLVYANLFRFMNDWSMVRFVGAVILQLMLLGSYYFLSRKAKMRFNSFCVTASAMILPYGVAYGRIVLYHTYYIPHIALGFLIVGLYLAVSDRARWQSQRIRNTVYAALLALLSFGAGLGGVRQVMITAVPLMISAVLIGLFDERRESALRQELPSLAAAAGTLVSCAAGYLVNVKVLASSFQFTDYSASMLSRVDFDTFDEILTALLRQFGYENEVILFSLPGLVSAGALAALVLGVILAIHTVRRGADRPARFLALYSLMTIVTMLLALCFISGEFVYVLYLLPASVWLLPAIGASDVVSADEKHPLTMHRFAAMLACVPLLIGGVYHSDLFRHPTTSGIRYDGLTYVETDTVPKLTPAVQFVTEQGYTLGYADFWDAAVVTELTDGQVNVVNILADDYTGAFTYQDWLASLSLRDRDFIAQQKVFMLLNWEMADNLDYNEALASHLNEVYHDENYCIYAVDEPTAVHDCLTSQASSVPDDDDNFFSDDSDW